VIFIARGNFAKEEVIKKIIECFGQTNAFVYDKKLYVNTKEDGMPIQVCLTLTCPKTMVTPSGGTTAPEEPPKSAFSGGFDFETMGTATAEPEPFKPAEITQEERDNVRALMARLGL
jgi:hypothetical protein